MPSGSCRRASPDEGPRRRPRGRRARSSRARLDIVSDEHHSSGSRYTETTVTFSYPYARPALAVDCAVLGLDEDDLKVLLIRRDLEPFAGRWALPGGFVRVDESVDGAARRELAEETGASRVYLEQLYTFGAVDRDPRKRVVSVAYYALVNL